MLGRLALGLLTKEDPPIKVWDCQIDDGKVIINHQDLADALEIMRGSYKHRLELQTLVGEPLRTTEQLKNGEVKWQSQSH